MIKYLAGVLLISLASVVYSQPDDFKLITSGTVCASQKVVQEIIEKDNMEVVLSYESHIIVEGQMLNGVAYIFTDRRMTNIVVLFQPNVYQSVLYAQSIGNNITPIQPRGI